MGTSGNFIQITFFFVKSLASPFIKVISRLKQEADFSTGFDPTEKSDGISSKLK